MQSILDRLVAPLPTGRAVIYISERWRAVLPSVQRGFSPEFLQKIASSGAGEYISELAYRRGGFVSFRNLSEMPEPLPAFPGARFEQFRQVLETERIRNLTAVSLQTREHNFGVILFPHAARRVLGSSNLRLLIGLALQIGLTLENYVVMHDTQRRTKEFELLTQIGQAISSRLDQDEVLRAIQKELGQIFDTSEFYIAFQEGDEIRFELEVVNGEVQPKRSRKAGNGLTDYIIRAGQPLLVRAELEKARERLGVTFVPGKPAKCFCAVPILLGGKPAGVMAAMNTEREYVFEQRDLEVMQIAGGQLSVAVENARLFAEEQRRARQFAFLNSISKTAISSEDSEQMLAEIVSHIQKNFRFDHIGIGIFDYFTKEIEIRAEAGITAQVLGKRIPLGTGIVGRVARTGETALVQMTGDQRLEGDLVLARVGRLLEQKCRQSNVVARYGGDEFIILMPETGVEQAQILAERLRLWISTDPMLQEQHITGSFGVGSFPVHGFSVEDIIRVADAGMYVSKHKGGDRVSTAEEFADGETAAVQRQLISGYIEGFLQREHTGPEHLEELLTTLKKMCGDDEGRNFVVLREAIETFTRVAESRDLTSSGHVEMVANYGETIARSLRLTPENVGDLVYAAGVTAGAKFFVPERTLNKSGPLTDDEFYILKMHSRVGGEILATIPGSENIQKAVEHHHEAFDGVGYPARLRGEEIPLWARIIAIADAYVNMTTDRSFATAKTSEQALNELEKLSGTRYDGMLVRILLRELKQEKASSSLSG